MMLRIFRLLTVAAVLLLGLVVASASEIEARGTSLLVNGVLVLNLKSEQDGIAPETRASLMAGQLEEFADAPVISTRRNGEGIDLLVGDRRLLTVTKLDAQDQKSTPEALAETWAFKLKQALAMPDLALDTTPITIPVAGSKAIVLKGSKASKAAFESSDTRVAEAVTVNGGFTVKGNAPGAASILIRAGKSSEVLNVRVRPYAGELPGQVVAEVTGNPAAGSAVRGAISYALRTEVHKLPYATTALSLPDAGAMGASQTKTFPVRVRITAPNTFDRVGYVNVVVKNLPIETPPDDALWYCNDPEIVKSSRNLFAADLKLGTSARLLYHHINGTSIPLYIRIQAINDSEKPARVLLTPGDAPPHKNPVQAGIDAADLYLRSWQKGSGEVITIPPGCSIPISLREILPNRTASGLCGIRLLDGPDDILVRADSWPPFRLDDRWRGAVASTAPWREVGANLINAFDTAGYTRSLHIYPNPYLQAKVNYNVGGRHAFLRIGQLPISRPEYGLNLDGNFGVIYDIAATMQNKTAAATDVEVVFEASAGYSAGLFLLNGAIERTPLLFPRQESRIAKVHLNAGESKTLKITTLPLSGSSYPATLTIRPIVTTAPPATK